MLKTLYKVHSMHYHLGGFKEDINMKLKTLLNSFTGNFSLYKGERISGEFVGDYLCLTGSFIAHGEDPKENDDFHARLNALMENRVVEFFLNGKGDITVYVK